MLAQGAAEVTLLESLVFEGTNAYIPEMNNPDPILWRRGHLIFCTADFCCVWKKSSWEKGQSVWRLSEPKALALSEGVTT